MPDRIKIKYLCVYCREFMPAYIEGLWPGVLLKCPRCQKLTRVDLVKDAEDRQRDTPGKPYRPEVDY